MSKYTAEQVSDLADRLELNAQDRYGALHGVRCESAAAILRDYAASLREREAAKAGVTDEDVLRACSAYDGYSSAPRARHGAMRAALEAVAPMLASAQVPDEVFEALRSVFHAGWNIDQFRVSCHKDLDILRDWMLAAAPKREEG